MPSIDIQLHNDKQNEKIVLDCVKVQDYIDHIILQCHPDIQYTDGSKDPQSEITSAAVFIRQFKVNILKRTSDHISVFTSEIAIMPPKCRDCPPKRDGMQRSEI